MDTRKGFAYANKLSTHRVLAVPGTEWYKDAYSEDVQKWLDGESYTGNNPVILQGFIDGTINNTYVKDQLPLLVEQLKMQNRQEFAINHNLVRAKHGNSTYHYDHSIERWVNGYSFVPSNTWIPKEDIELLNTLDTLIEKYCIDNALPFDGREREDVYIYMLRLNSEIFHVDHVSKRYNREEACYMFHKLKEQYRIHNVEELFGDIKNAANTS